METCEIISSIVVLYRYKLLEPMLLLGKDKFAGVDIRVRVKGGGHVSQVYAIRQAISKSLVAYYQKCEYFVLVCCNYRSKLGLATPFDIF